MRVSHRQRHEAREETDIPVELVSKFNQHPRSNQHLKGRFILECSRLFMHRTDKGPLPNHSWEHILALGLGDSHRRRRLRHENLYNFAKNLDQNGLLGEKLSQNENRSVKNFEIDFFDLDFFIVHTNFNEKFRFFRSQKFSKKSKIFDFSIFSY